MGDVELLTIPMVAQECGVSAMTVRRWIGAGQLAAQQPGREWLITRAALDTFRAKPRRPGRPRKQP